MSPSTSSSTGRTWAGLGLGKTLIILAFTVLASCGGGGGSSLAPAPVGVLQPPPADPPVEQEAPKTPVAHVNFVDATFESGLFFTHDINVQTMAGHVAAGIAVGDYNSDGWLDIYLAQGDTGFNKLFENRSQSGTYEFSDVANDAGVTGELEDKASGPAFADYDGDGDVDLFVGSVEYTPYRIFNNLGDGTFAEVTDASGLGDMSRENSVAMTFGDYDQDADLDLFIGHWTFTEGELPTGTTQHLWRNNGDGTFSDVSDESLITDTIIEASFDYTFAPTFADIDSDGDADLLVVADSGTTQVFGQ